MSGARYLSQMGMKIAARRRKCDLSQMELAHRVGLTRTSITNIEAGQQDTTILRLADIANALKVPAASLLPD